MPQPAPAKDLYRLQESHRIQLRIHYPTDLDNIVLRTDLDWEQDILPSKIDRDGSFAEFQFETTQPFVYLIPCLRRSNQLLWAVGPNNLVPATRDEILDGYPNFYSSSEGSVMDLITLDSKVLNRQHRLRVYVPAGYAENTLRSFPVMHMQDGSNLFFSDEAFMGQDWGVREKIATLDTMSAIQQMIIVGVYSADRMVEYTKPGYELYGRSVVEEVKPHIDAKFRTRPGPQNTGVMGSSLGGVVSFYMTWQ